MATINLRMYVVTRICRKSAKGNMPQKAMKQKTRVSRAWLTMVLAFVAQPEVPAVGAAAPVVEGPDVVKLADEVRGQRGHHHPGIQ